MMVQVGPCPVDNDIAQIIAAVGGIVTTCLTAFLAYRRVLADNEGERHRRNAQQLNYNMAQTLEDVQRKVNVIERNGS